MARQWKLNLILSSVLEVLGYWPSWHILSPGLQWPDSGKAATKVNETAKSQITLSNKKI